MAELEGRPGVSIPDDPEGTCSICHKEALECIGVKSICDACHNDGWREGAEMIQALRDDPVLGVDDNGNVTAVPDYKKKWNKQ